MGKVHRAWGLCCFAVCVGLTFWIAFGSFPRWQTPLVTAACCIWAVILSHDHETVRWLCWNMRCLRGRRCANMTFDGPPSGTVMAPDGSVHEFEIPAGSIGQMTYMCGGCGTVYSSSVIVNGETWTQTDRERVG